jgi:hypothetical protein
MKEGKEIFIQIERPQGKNYVKASGLLIFKTLVSYMFYILSVAGAVFINIPKLVWLSPIFIGFSSILLIVEVFVSGLFHIALQEAEKNRRDGLVDNSFGTTLASLSSEKYYDTKGIPYGFEKMLASEHESSLFTSNISEKMLKRKTVKCFIALVPVLVFFYLGFFRCEFSEVYLSFVLSGLILTEWYPLFRLHKEVTEIEDNIRKIWSDFPEQTDRRDIVVFEIKCIQLVIQYECSLARAGIILNQNEYEKQNPKLMGDWDKIKKRERIR